MKNNPIPDNAIETLIYEELSRLKRAVEYIEDAQRTTKELEKQLKEYQENVQINKEIYSQIKSELNIHNKTWRDKLDLIEYKINKLQTEKIQISKNSNVDTEIALIKRSVDKQITLINGEIKRINTGNLEANKLLSEKLNKLKDSIYSIKSVDSKREAEIIFINNSLKKAIKDKNVLKNQLLEEREERLELEKKVNLMLILLVIVTITLLIDIISLYTDKF